MDDQASGKFGLNLGAGMVIGLLVGLGASTVYAQHAAKRARMGWNLVPVIVASEDIKAGSVVTYDMISQRAVPEQFVTESVVRPAAANDIVMKKVQLPLHAGDVLLWPMFPKEPLAAAPDAGAAQQPR